VAKHKYWNKAEKAWAGFITERKFISAHFEHKPITIFLGSEFDDAWEQIEIPPRVEELDDFASTYLNFVNDFDIIIDDIKGETFAYYQKYYAHYYENEKKSGEKALNIDSKERHFENIKDIIHLRILDKENIQIPIHYKIDSEHGIEIRLENNKIIKIGGIAET